MPDPSPPPTDARVLSYLAVRRALGLLGVVLPTALYVYARAVGYGMQPSISEFYHTHMGDFLVGCLVAIGIFLIAYQGYPRQPGEALSDRWVSTVAGLSAIGVALFPVVPPDLAACPAGQTFPVAGTDPVRDVLCPVQGLVRHWTTFAWIHFASAAVFFLCLAAFCLVLFPKGDTRPDGRIDWRAPKNRVYLVCGGLILAAMALVTLYALLPDGAQAALRGVNYIFWCETVAVLAFAVSWLTKGKLHEGIARMLDTGGEG